MTICSSERFFPKPKQRAFHYKEFSWGDLLALYRMITLRIQIGQQEPSKGPCIQNTFLNTFLTTHHEWKMNDNGWSLFISMWMNIKWMMLDEFYTWNMDIVEIHPSSSFSMYNVGTISQIQWCEYIHESGQWWMNIHVWTSSMNDDINNDVDN